ncbi:MAG: bacteriocin fulvocin C-related protein [Bacteroidales bacterium]|nr:bacteriocin fulvocin C-related protein [Bacteroidales bacterium]
MKKYLLFIVCIFTLTSCEKNVIYSCNPEVNEWVQDNVQLIKKMDRTSWKKVTDIEKRAAIYVAFSPQQRKQFWIEKINEMLKMPFLPEELTHIKRLFYIIEEYPYMFENEMIETEEQKEERELVIQDWIQTGISSFGWSESFVADMVASGEELQLEGGTLKKTGTGPGSVDDNPERGTCNCDKDQFFPWCKFCENGTCNKQPTGCGFFLAYKCDGLCDGL